MEKTKIDAHSSLVIIDPGNGDETILSGYDCKLFVPPIYRSKPNFIGGNPNISEKEKCGPYEVAVREVSEELDRGKEKSDWKGRPIQWAELEDILKVRKAVLTNMQPYKDFFGYIGKMERCSKWENCNFIQSVFISKVSKDVLECVRENIKNGKTMVTEGYLGIHYLGQLAMAGEHSTAYFSGPILSDYYGVNISSPEEIDIDELGLVRKYFKDYEKEFEYKHRVWRL